MLPPIPSVKRLLLRDTHIIELNATLLQHLTELHTLELINGRINTTTGLWQNPNLRVINLSSNNFTTFNLSWLERLPELTSLNLSGNPLRSITGHPAVEERLLSLDLSGRSWDCTDHAMTWLVGWLRRSPPRTVAGEAETRCREHRKQYLTMDGQRLVDVLRVTDVSLRQSSLYSIAQSRSSIAYSTHWAI